MFKFISTSLYSKNNIRKQVLYLGTSYCRYGTSDVQEAEQIIRKASYVSGTDIDDTHRA